MDKIKKFTTFILAVAFSLSVFCASGCSCIGGLKSNSDNWWEKPDKNVFLVEEGDLLIEKDTNYIHGVSLQGSESAEIVLPELLNGKAPIIPEEDVRYVNTNEEVSYHNHNKIKKIFFNYKTNENFTQAQLLRQAKLWHDKWQYERSDTFQIPFASRQAVSFKYNYIPIAGVITSNDSNLTQGGNKIFCNSYVARNYIAENGLVYAGEFDGTSFYSNLGIKFLLANVQFLYNYDGAPNQGYYWIDYCYISRPYKPADPTREGYTFAGWYKDKEFTKPLDFTKTIATEHLIGEGFQLGDYAYPELYTSIKLYYPENYVTYVYAKWEKVD